MPQSNPSVCLGCGAELNELDSECPRCGMALPATDATVVRRGSQEILDGKWALERKLGQGGMGVVHLATDLELERKVAIKMLSASLAHEPEVVARFEREARMMAKLDHPNLVPIWAVGRTGGVPFIVMKYLEGRPLSDYLRESGRLEVREAVGLMRQLCSGLGLVHARGFIHRDIKPANVIIGDDGHATILDLGVARDSKNAMTRSGLLIGTPKYMAPEQIAGAGKIDHRADLYSLATVLYEMLTGAPVYDSESDYSVMKMHIEAAVPDASQVPGVSRKVAGVVQKALAKSPDDRYQSAAELYQALAEAAVDEPDTRLAPITPYPTTLRRARLAHAAAQPTVPPAPEKPPPPDRPAAKEPVPSPSRLEAMAIRRPAGPIAAAVLVGMVAIAAALYFALRPAPEEAPPSEEPPRAANTAEATRAPSAAPAQPWATVSAPAPQAAAEPAEGAAPSETAPSGGAPSGVPATGAPAAAEAAPSLSAEARRARPSGASSAGELRVVATVRGALSWAWLDVDGTRKGITPITLKLPPGKHSLRLSRPGFKPVARDVEVPSRRTTKVSIELEE
ncbi:MAG: serine/threonine protein kinase [Myxococcales bacterium]|nr:serine/threonine protein kinase [Myxococcales bacterium]